MQATTVLVEGESDRLAVEVLARQSGHDLHAERVTVVPMGGATSIVRFLAHYGPAGANHRIRSLGIEAVLGVIEAQGELASFRLLQRQPSQRGHPVPAQLRRFFGGRSGNKIRYAPLLVSAVPAGQAPEPLARLVEAFACGS